MTTPRLCSGSSSARTREMDKRVGLENPVVGGKRSIHTYIRRERNLADKLWFSLYCRESVCVCVCAWKIA